MDNSFQSMQNSRLSLPYGSRSRSSLGGNSLSSRRSVQSGFKKPTTYSSRASIAGRSAQSTQLIARSDNNVIQSFGLPLPITVNEALTFSERNTSVSVNCGKNGWAWVVYGRKLLVWQYKETKFSSPKFEGVRTPQRRPVMSQCRELTLPHCDIGHKATLVNVFTTEGQQMASCLAVSPTGDIRYWPSIANDGISIDENNILDGQEFDELLNIPSIGYILVTTTCRLVLLQLQLVNGRHSIVHRNVRPPSGFFCSIGKRLSSYIIGNNAQDRENRYLKICSEKGDSYNWIISILSDKWIQRWSMDSNGAETFLFEDFEIVRNAKEVFHRNLWPNQDINYIEIFLLDMHAANGCLYVLASATNLDHTPQMHYAILTLNLNENSLSIANICVIKATRYFTGDANDENLKMKFILNRSVAYVYGERFIYEVLLHVDLKNGVENTEKIELPTQTDEIMAAVIYKQIPIFFSRIHGFVSVSSSDFDGFDLVNQNVTGADVLDASHISVHNETAANLTIYDINPDEVYCADDIISQMKAAFIYHLKKNNTKCASILQQLLSDSKVAAELDKVVIKIAQDLAEDIPAADPRWEEQLAANQKYGLGSSASMQIIQQLREKSKALGHFVEFLHSSGLWNELDTIAEKSQVKSTFHILSDINEKIVAAIALKTIHNAHSLLIDEAIENVLKKRNEIPPGSLTAQDLFYVQVTRIQDLIKVFASIVDDFLNREQSSSKVSQYLLDIGTIILAMLREVCKFREQKSTLFAPPVNKASKYEYIPWTSASGNGGIRDSLLHLITATWQHGIRSTGEPELQQRHFKNLVDLVDFILDGRRAYLESIKDQEKYAGLQQKYESQRSDLLFDFVDAEQYELAAKLAEKYLDFQVLVVICDKTKNQSRLDEYIERFKEHDFSQFAINWHLQQNKRGDLFERFKRNQADLTRFLGDHPSLAWMQAIFNGNLAKAARTLLTLAQNETELCTRKKTVLSLAKLACLAADENLTEQIEYINSELTLISYQDQVPKHLLTIFGYDTENPKVLKPEEIINLLIAEENEDATEYDYQKALAIIPFVEDSEDIKHKIWCSAILRDRWDSYNINAPQETIQQLMFFKLIDLCFFIVPDLEEFLPPMENILKAPEIGSLASSKSFQFLLKFGYEHIYETLNKN